MPSKHLAILCQPFLDLILSGQKTIETRFTQVKCAPFQKVKTGDIILLKETGGLVLGEFTAGKVEYFDDMSPVKIEALKAFSKEIAADAVEDFWTPRLKAKYVSFIHVTHVKKYEKPLPFVKKDRRAWVVLEDTLSYREPDLFDKL